MPSISAIFLALSLILAVAIGPQTRSWTWGPAMLAMAVALVAAIPAIWQRRKSGWDFGWLAYAAVVAGWFAWRAWTSPVVEFGQADLILLAGGVSAFVVMRGIEGNAVAEKILTWSIALLLLANVLAVFKQVQDPAFSPVFKERAAEFPSGFYAHYNEAANFLIATTMWVAAAAFFGKHAGAGRIFLGVIALGGLAAVFYTRSRGGIFGAATGTGVFAVAALVAGKRTGAKWFAPALLALPVIGLGIVAFLYFGWAGRQAIHAVNTGGTMANIFDNNSRLFFLGIAMSCIGLHPLAGGGSRSFSWECYRFFEGSAQGMSVTTLPQQVHNELVQSATDYGLIGAGLLTGLLGSLVVIAVIRLLFSGSETENPQNDAWRIGGLAALAGMFVQSCFSFVFHLFPGILLLGICLGQLARSQGDAGTKSGGLGAKLLLSLVAASGVALLVPFGWKGTQVTSVLWPSYFSKHATIAAEAKAEALGKAVRIWPQSSLYQDRALIFQQLSAAEGAGAEVAAQQAIDDYTQAGQLHPYQPDLAVNLGNLASFLKQDALAEAAYARAIPLQGGMEASFRAHFSLANHLMAKGQRLYVPANPGPAAAAMEEAAKHMEQAVSEMPYGTDQVMWSPRVTAQECLGFARETMGDNPGAIKAYDFAAQLWGGSRAHFRAAELYRKMGHEIWLKRNPEQAMGYFMEARRRIGLTAELPSGVTPQRRAEVITSLDQMIAFFQRVKIQPLPVPAE